MRLLFLSPFDPFKAETGPAYHLRGLSKALYKLGCEVHIMVFEPGNSSSILNEIQLHYFYRTINPVLRIPFVKGHVLSLISFREVNRLCREYKIDIVHGQSPLSWIYGLLHMNDIPFVVTLHATSFSEFVSYFDVPFSCVNKDVVLALLGEMMECFPAFIKYKRVDKVIAVSEAIAREAVRFYCLPKKNVVTIHNGIDLQSFSEVHEKKRVQHRILSVGRLVWRKGYKYLIDAMPRILSEYPDAKLVIVGYGDQKIPLKKHIKKLGIDSSVCFLENVSRERLYSLYREAEVYVQPSLYEPFGITILEAMSMRKPVIASRVGGIPEIITNGVDGVLVEPRNSLQLARAIVYLFSDSSLRKRLGDNARKRVEKEFTWEVIAKKTLELYKSLLHHNC